MSASRLETLVWVLIYGGLILVALGFAMPHSENTLGWTLIVLGGVIAAVGAVLIWVRSRLPDDPA